MGMSDPLKKWKRSFDNLLTYRKFIFFIITVVLFLAYVWPDLFFFSSDTSQTNEDLLNRCIEESLLRYYEDKHLSNADFRYEPKIEDDNSFLPFVGNGLLGVTVGRESSLYLRGLRTLSQNTHWSPIVSANIRVLTKEVYVSHFISGTVHRHQCLIDGLKLSSLYYAHRVVPNLFIQEIKVVNPTNKVMKIQMNNPSFPAWATVSTRYARSLDNSEPANDQYHLLSGRIDSHIANEDLAIAILIKAWPSYIEILPHQSTLLNVPSVLYYEKLLKTEYARKKTQIENKPFEVLKNITKLSTLRLEQEHTYSWQNLWKSGLAISQSKAAGALNGDRINATLYYILSNVLLYSESRNASTDLKQFQRSSYLTQAEGCYGGYHHTLHAANLWNPLSTMKEVNESVSLWLLTLEKQGCHKLIKDGADNVMQAIILSFGGFRFSTHHLEFKIDPKYLHRDYYFRRIRYNYGTHINISVTLQEDNKALLGVSLDEHDANYYACDGGCLDQHVLLSSSVSYFPVKVTDPITSILYITSDKDHIELIKDTLHVHKIVEAPAHDHQVIALHRHGHHLGGLPLMFWASVCFLIVIFHLFLFKLIFNEYCGKQEKYKVRYARV